MNLNRNMRAKMSFYLSLADEHLKSAGDEPSIGLILCKTKDSTGSGIHFTGCEKGQLVFLNIVLAKNCRQIYRELPSVEDIENPLR